MNLLSKLIFYLKRPKIVVITGNYSQTATEDVFKVLKNYFKAGKFQKRKNPSFLDILRLDILIFEKDEEDLKNFKFFFNKSGKPILVITSAISFLISSGSLEEQMKKILPSFGYLILNSDTQIVREIKNKTQDYFLTFGFQEGADLRATDVHLNKIETNFKINYKGNIIPFWLEKSFNKEQIYSALAAAGVGVVLGINLVEISEALKYEPVAPLPVISS